MRVPERTLFGTLSTKDLLFCELQALRPERPSRFISEVIDFTRILVEAKPVTVPGKPGQLTNSTRSPIRNKYCLLMPNLGGVTDQLQYCWKPQHSICHHHLLIPIP